MTPPEPAPEVVRDDETHRYQLMLGGQVVGFSQFRVRPGYLVFTHTETDPAFEGRGFGSTLAKGALDDVPGPGRENQGGVPVHRRICQTTPRIRGSAGLLSRKCRTGEAGWGHVRGA